MGYYSSQPEKLIEAIQENRCILFVGSGISRKCISTGRKPLPTWNEFLKRFIIWKNKKYNFDDDYYNELKELLDRNKYLIVAEELLENIDEREFQEYLNSVFDPQSIQPSYLHKLISLIPFRGIITTNYDNLIELSFVDMNKRMPDIYTNSDVLSGKNPMSSDNFILKMHGDIEDPQSIILSQKSYSELLYNSSGYQQLLEKIFSDYVILFIGYGGSDPNVESTIDKISLHDGKSRHFMLSKEGSLTNIEKKRFQKDKKLSVIEYVDYFGLHNHIDTFFSDLLKNIFDEEKLSKIPKKLRTRIKVFYDKKDSNDGNFLWYYFFRNGAVTLSAKPQNNQYDIFLNNFKEYAENLDYLTIYLGDAKLAKNNPFYKKVISIYKNIELYDFQLIIVALNKNKATVKKDFQNAITFFVKKNFIDVDLQDLKSFLVNQIQ